MGLLRLIWRDMLWLNLRRPVVKITGLIIVIALIGTALYLGPEWWTTTDYWRKSGRWVPRWERAGVIIGIPFLLYLISLIDRLFNKT